MAEIDFLFVEQVEGTITSGKRATYKKRTGLVRLQEEMWHGFSLRIHRMNAGWMENPHRIQDYVEKQREMKAQLWTDRVLDPVLAGYVQPLPSPQLACFFMKNLPFRQNMIFHRGNVPWEWGRYWQEKFLETVYQELNGLYLLGDDDVDERFLERIYEDSGLLAAAAEQIPEVDGRKSVFVDLDRTDPVDHRRIPPGCLYLDLTSDREKQRCFAIKRTDISYVSARNCLDTALKARYNAI